MGFWTGRGEPAVVDWCEPNYAVTPYVAEFWNTLSSLPMAALGLAGLWWWWSSRGTLTRRFAWLFAGLLVVGLGSVAFHGTLLRVPQALDELPMVYVGLVGAWVFRYRDRRPGEGRAAAWAMAVYGVLFTVAYWVSTATFLVFLASYSFLVAYIALGSMRVTWFGPAPVLQSRLLALAAGGFLGALTIFWIPEHVLLPCDHPLQALHLHSLWHLGAGTGTYAWYLWAIVDRWALVDGRRARWSGLFLEPA